MPCSGPAAHSLLISDLHLCDARPDLNAAFSWFCRTHAAHCERLYILGDLSDAWVGDDDDSETALLIRDTLRELSQAGVAVFLMTGNRDFLIGQQLASDCGLHLLADPSVVDLYGRQVLLMHGDSLCTGDAEYMAFRAQIQNKDAQKTLLAQSLEQRRQLAASLRAQSKSANSNKAEDIMDVTQAEVERVCIEHGVTTLIHGHTHRPAVHPFDLPTNNGQSQAAQRMVLGDWGSKGWYIKANSEALVLESFVITQAMR